MSPGRPPGICAKSLLGKWMEAVGAVATKEKARHPWPDTMSQRPFSPRGAQVQRPPARLKIRLSTEEPTDGQ